VQLAGGDRARITLVTTATGMPDEVHAEYERMFRKLGVDNTRELRLRGLTALIRAAMAAQRPDVTIATADGPGDALRSALALASGSAPVLLLYEKLGPVTAALAALNAVPLPADRGRAGWGQPPAGRSE
jgi:cyanophycinase